VPTLYSIVELMLHERKIFDFHRKKRLAFSRGRIIVRHELYYRNIGPMPKHLFHFHFDTATK